MHGCRHGIAMVNGTVTLRLCLIAAGLEAGCEVVIPPYTFFSTASAVVEANMVPVFADVDLETFNLDPRALEAAITPRTRAVIPVHFAGQVADMDAIMAIAEKHHLLVIEDAAHAHGGSYKNRAVGQLGNVASFSFQSTKNLTAAREASSRPMTQSAEACRSIHNCGRLPRGNVVRASRDFRQLPPGGTARPFLTAQLERLEARRSKPAMSTASIWPRGSRNCRDFIRKAGPSCTRNAYHLFMLRIDSRQFGAPRPSGDRGPAGRGDPLLRGLWLFASPAADVS